MLGYTYGTSSQAVERISTACRSLEKGVESPRRPRVSGFASTVRSEKWSKEAAEPRRIIHPVDDEEFNSCACRLQSGIREP